VQRISHTLVTLLLAAWLPFCCCQARAAMNAVVAHSAHSAHSTGANEGCCCSEEPATDASESKDPCPDKSGGCCTSCKDRVLPSATSVPPADEIGTDWVACAFALHVHSTAADAYSDGCAHSTGPPGVRSGRLILQQSGVLLV
jgi:hypothetical protein